MPDLGSSGTGEANTSSNEGTGEGTLAKAKSGVNLPFKTLKQGTNITLTNNADDVTIAASGGGGGEANTASNVGTAGVGVWKQKTGVDLEFKKLNSDGTITITDDTGNSEVDITRAALTGDVTSSAGSNVTAIGAGVIVDADVNASGITTRSKLPSAIVYDDETNVFGDFNQDFKDDKLRIENPAGTFHYNFVAAAIASACNLNLPNVVGANTLVVRNSSDILLNKTIANSGNTLTFDADQTFAAGVTFTQESAFTGIISPAQITATQNDYNPTDLATSTVLRLNTDASRSITGLQGGAIGRIIIIHNVGTQNIILEDEDASSTASNRFALNADFTLGADQSCILQYDATSSRWRLTSSSVVGAAGGGEANTASNVGTGGVGVFKVKSGVDLQFKKVNSGTGITITDDTGNDEVDIAIDSTVVTESSTDTLTNKTLTTPVLTTPTINGSKLAQAAKTTNYTMTATDYVVRCDASAGAFTITLPAAATAGAGTIYKIIRTDITSSTELLTVDGNAAETIDGMANWKLHQGEFLVIMSDGTNWVTISHPNPATDGYYYLKNPTNNRRYIQGHLNSNVATVITTTSPAANTLWALPFIVGKVTKFDTISFHITTAQAAQNANAGIYYDDGNCYPGALIFNTGSVSTGTTGVKDTTITSSLQLFQPGLYWLAWETSATTCQIRGISGATAVMAILGSDSTLTGLKGYGYSVADTYGATLPDPYPAGGTILTTNPSVSVPVPALGLRPI